MKNKKTTIAAAAILAVAGGCYIAGSQIMLNEAEKSYSRLVEKINQVDGLEVVEEVSNFGFLKAKGTITIGQAVQAWGVKNSAPKVLSHVEWSGSPSLKGFSVDGVINHTLSTNLTLEPYMREQLKKGLGVESWGELKLSAIASNETHIAISNPTEKPFYLTPLFMGDIYAIASGSTQIEFTQSKTNLAIKLSAKDGALTLIHAKSLFDERFSLEHSELSNAYAKIDDYNGHLELSNGRIQSFGLKALDATYAESQQKVGAKNIDISFDERTKKFNDKATVSYAISMSTDGINAQGQSFGKASVKANLGDLTRDSFYFVAEKLPMIAKGTQEGREYDRGGKKHRQMLHHVQNLLEDSPKLDISNLNLTIDFNGMEIDLDAKGYLAFNAEGLPKNLMLRSEDRLQSYDFRKHLDLLLDANLPMPLLQTMGIPMQISNSDRQEIKIKDSVFYFNGMQLMKF